MVNARTGSSHKPFGVISNKIRNISGLKEVSNKISSHSSGQCDSLELSVKDGGNGVPSDDQALQGNLGIYLFQKEITITAEYLPGILNVNADWESRHTRDMSEWKLCPNVFWKMTQKLGHPQIDLFASRPTHQVVEYCSWKPDPYSRATNALQQDSSKFQLLYAFPPFALIHKVLRKIRQERLPGLILITPLWQGQSWCPELLGMSVFNPVLLPQQNHLLLNPKGKTHPLILNKSLRLAAWMVSGLGWRRKAYLQELPILSLPVDENLLIQLTHQPGISGLAGMTSTRLISFDAL